MKTKLETKFKDNTRRSNSRKGYGAAMPLVCFTSVFSKNPGEHLGMNIVDQGTQQGPRLSH